MKLPALIPTEYGSKAMSRVRSKGTRPELTIRSLVHRMGFRFRLHRADLPGRPDLVFPGRRCVIFVHGCFWHSHSCPAGIRRPKSNRAFWVAKIEGNRQRDTRIARRLRRLGWRVMTIWACEPETKVMRRIDRFLNFHRV